MLKLHISLIVMPNYLYGQMFVRKNYIEASMHMCAITKN